MHHVLFNQAMNCWCVFENVGVHQLRLVCKAENKYRAEKYAKNLDRNKKIKLNGDDDEKF